jgi:iron complex outermembrane receptor protein
MWRKAVATVALIGAAAGAVDARDVPRAGQSLSDLSFEDLMQVRVESVFGAAKRLQPATEAPSSVSVITAADIERYGYRSLADILRSARGLYVTDDRNYSYVGVRGFGQPGDYNTRVLILVDGHRVNDDVYDQAPVGAELGLDPATFERVEIIRGPSSALYGTSAFFAVVNVVTKPGAAIDGVRIGVEGGTFDTRRAYAAVGTKTASGVDLAFSANVETSDGQHDLYYPEFDAPETNGGHAIGIDGERVRGLTGRVTNGGFTLLGAYGWRRKVVPTASFGVTFNDPGFYTIDERAFVDASYDRDWQGTKYSVRAYADRYRYDGEYPYPALVDDAPSVIQTDYGHGVWWGTDLRATRTVAGGQTIVGGIEWRDYVTQEQGAAFRDNRTPPFATSGTTHVFAGYLQDEIRVHERWLVSVGGRYDSYSGFGQFSPRASIVFAATPNRSFKYLLGNAFRAPNAYEFDYLTSGVRNTRLKPETLNTSEVAWEEYVGGWLRTSVSAYRNRVEGLLTLISDDEDVLHYTNGGRVLARGLEFEGEFRNPHGVQALVSYAVQRARDRDSGAELVNSPRHLAKARLSITGPTRASTIAFEMQAMSRRLLIGGGTAAAHAVAHLNYVQPVGPDLTIVAAIRNLFGSDYADPASEEHVQLTIPQDGRAFRVGVQWAWKN